MGRFYRGSVERFYVDWDVTHDEEEPVVFGLEFDLDGASFSVRGLGMSDMTELGQAIDETVREARQAGSRPGPAPDRGEVA